MNFLLYLLTIIFLVYGCATGEGAKLREYHVPISFSVAEGASGNTQ
jgi:hypothetical protein